MTRFWNAIETLSGLGAILLSAFLVIGGIRSDLPGNVYGRQHANEYLLLVGLVLINRATDRP